VGGAAARILFLERRVRAGSREMVVMSVLGGSEARMSATTFSFSSGSREQVE